MTGVGDFEVLARASAGFERRLRLVGPSDWPRPTPCDEWDVRALVNHVVGANRRYTMLLHGATAPEVDATRTVDHLGDDAVAAFLTTGAEMTAAFREPGALVRTAHHPSGDRTGRELLDMRALDVAVHSWDLARAIGADETLDADVVAFALALDLSGLGAAFAPPVADIPPQDSPQVRLLHAVGRSPG